MAAIRKPAIIGFFNEPDEFLQAGVQARTEGFQNLDGFMPYPVHGFDEALGISRSLLPRASFAAIVTGASLGFLLQFWTHGYDWPMNVGGKPFFAWPAYIVITFESGVLLCTLTTISATFLMCRLFPNPFTKVVDEDLTNDRFALVIPAGDSAKQEEAANLLQRMGADEIRILD